MADLSPTFYKLFPEIKTVPDKAWAFLECYYRNGCSYRATGRELDISPKTVKRIYKDCKSMDVYEIFMEKVNAGIQDFSDPEFNKKIFNRYEAFLSDINDRIKEVGDDPTEARQLLKLKHKVLKDQLKASIKFATKGDMEDTEDIVATAAQEAYEEAKEQYYS